MDAPIAPAAPARRGVAPYVVGLLTLLLTFELAFQSSELHTLELALREVQALQQERPQEKLYQAWRKLNIEGVYNAPLATAGTMDEYQKLVDSAREWADRRGAIVKLLLDASVMHAWPPPATRDERETPELRPMPPPGDCRERPVQIASARDLPAIDPFVRQRDCFLALLHIAPGDIDYPLWSLSYSARDKVNLLLAWLLPALYGLLGACVAVMRIELQRGASDRVSVLAAVTLLYRLALGGLAGIIVGWFWTPGAVTPGAASAVALVPEVPSLSFGVAFLAGFSIERLFDVLDELILKLTPQPKDR